MGTYGHTTEKPELGLGNVQPGSNPDWVDTFLRPWLWKLYRKLTPDIKADIKKRKRLSDHEMVKVTFVEGQRKVTGGKDLTSSSAYPADFGKVVCALHSEWLATDPEMPDLAMLLQFGYQDPGGDWSHADLETIKTFLEEAITEGEFRPNGESFDIEAEMQQIYLWHAMLGDASSVPEQPAEVPGNPRKDLSGEFAKAASDKAAGALMASPQIKSPFHKKIKLDDHLETLTDNALAETQPDEFVGDQKPSLPKPPLFSDVQRKPESPMPESEPRSKTSDISAQATAEESQGNGPPEAAKISVDPPEAPDHKNKGTPKQNPSEGTPAEATAKESRGNESQKQNPDPPGPNDSRVGAPVAEHAAQVALDLVAHGRMPRHVDTQDTIPLNRGHSIVSDFQQAMVLGHTADPVLDMAHTLQARGNIDMFVPAESTCLDMQQSPGKLSEWVYRHGDADASGRAFEVLKWTRLVAAKYNGAFEAQDSGSGPLARSLHETCLSMLGLQKEYEEAKALFLKYSNIIVNVGATKKQQVQGKGFSAEVTQSKLDQIDKWVSQKLDEKDLSQQEVCKKLDGYVATFSETVLMLVANAESEYQSTNNSSLPEEDEEALCMDLDNHLNLQLQEKEVPPPSDTASTSALASPAAMPRAENPPESTEAAVPTKPSPKQELRKTKVEPQEFQTEEERLAWEAKEAKRLRHNARVRFDSADCPPVVLEKLGELQGQPNRLKTLSVWFQQWLEADEDWAKTQLVIDAVRVNEESIKANECMKTFKTLVELHGKKVAIEFELSETNKTSAGFHSEGNISSQAAGQLAPILMPNNAATGGTGRDVLSMLQKSSSTDSLKGGQKGEGKGEKLTKVNPNSVAKKLNVKIQALASKMTEIIVWSTELSDSSLSQKAKDNYQEELDGHKNQFSRIKGELEGLYSIHNKTKDVDMSEETKDSIQSLLERADAVVTNFTGAMKPLKMTLEPLMQRALYVCVCASSARQPLRHMYMYIYHFKLMI
ncbi:unnamed protein product [Symbiodinium sp. CCMP2456]|nr:unnamed protein product [Symbiodinium sp. CCMP2456]